MSVGLDIGSKTIKVVELSNERNIISLKTASIVGHASADIDKMQEDADFANIAGVIKKLWNDAKVSSNKVAISLPESAVFSRIVRFPMLSDQEVASAIRWEAEEYIPIPPKEAVISYQIVEKKESASPPEVVVLLIASPRNIVEKYVKLVEIAGLTVVGVETSLLSLVRALAPVNQTAVLMDFGAKSTNLAISKNGQLLLSRSIPTAGDAFTRAVAQSLGVSESQADEYKRAYGMDNDQVGVKIGGALGPIFRIVSEEVKKAVHFYQNDESADVPSILILSGGTSGLPGIVPTMTRLLGMEVLIGNPFSKIAVDPKIVADLESYSPLYSVAVGLALRND
ncbi:MAG: type IV pilus assembly protein PilM [Candidatus Woesebacteria bacterium]|nr:MAG: type IV pilus assembly protein PilM [Candidatus Woesebacteria bacterium]